MHIFCFQMAQARLDPNIKTDKLIFTHPDLNEKVSLVCCEKIRNFENA